MQVDTSAWSGEGTFTSLLVERLKEIEQVAAIRVEDAPASRSEADYNFISNEIFVAFTTVERQEPVRRLGFLPGSRTVFEPSIAVSGLESVLASFPDVGPADYSDEGMIQYLRTERIVPPYQTRGYKLVELVRVYEVNRRDGSSNAASR
ncbi:MAG: hypothetical protein C5B57_13455 [Blastocatellia bacterium]|nr:MAG: hypothetical protein C5B57_13455 [Blastocatellia bacterium]